MAELRALGWILATVDQQAGSDKGEQMAGSSRRSFLAGAGMAAAVCATRPMFGMAPASTSPFKVSVITDEISPDFDHACSVAANEFGMEWVEIRDLWKKSLHSLSDDELAEAEKILKKYKLRVTDIASPLFKVDWPGAPLAKTSEHHDFADADTTFKQQSDLLDRCIELAKRFGTDKIRCFDFWRITDVTPYRAAINAKLTEAAETCGKHGVLLVMENEFACNTGTAPEAAAVLAAVTTPHFGLNWDAGNAVMRGELDAFPKGWDLLPKDRIKHCHVKNAVTGPDGKIVWSPVGTGYIDWTAQFRALKQMGYHQAVSLETHWRGAATPEESTRVSWGGMKKALENAGAW
jgi:sugar phosphate isomerase/epimerase